MILDQDSRKRPQVLFLCTHNTARSQMAEAWLKKHAGDRFEVYSAGFESTDINPFTRQVMAEVGLDLSGQSSKGVKEYLGKINFAYVIIVCARAEKICPNRLYFSRVTTGLLCPSMRATQFMFSPTEMASVAKVWRIR